MSLYTVVNPPKVRAAPSFRATVLDVALQTGDQLNIIETRRINGALWGAYEIVVGGASPARRGRVWSCIRSRSYVFMTINAVVEPPPPPPPPAQNDRYRIGINALANLELAVRELERGCRYVMLMNRAREIREQNLPSRFPNAFIISRVFLEHGRFFSADEIIARQDGMRGLCHYIGHNEADPGEQDGDDLIKRLRIDVEIAQRLRQLHGGNYGPQPGKAFYHALTASIGRPDFTSQRTCDILREHLAPHYNSGLIGIDMHLYSPNISQITNTNLVPWYERRWEFLFTRCGFDPGVRNVHCTETGEDNGRGFIGNSRSHQEVADWLNAYIHVQSVPLVMNNTYYTSPIRGGALFQLGGNGDPRWEPFDVAHYLDVIRARY